jgi:hypothetical protein
VAGPAICADGAQLVHDLAMHRADVAAFGGSGIDIGRVAENGFFDTKTFAMTGMSFSHPFTPQVL